MLESISISNLKKLESPNLIDIRSIEKYNSNHIRNAINIPLEQLLINPSKYLSKSIKYYIYCQTGIRSLKLCRILKSNGYDVVNVSGGYEAWILSE